MKQSLSLATNGFGYRGMTVAKVRDGDPGKKIEVLPPVGVPERGSLASHKSQPASPIGVEHMPIVELFDFERIQFIRPLPDATTQDACGTSCVWHDADTNVDGTPTATPRQENGRRLSLSAKSIILNP